MVESVTGQADRIQGDRKLVASVVYLSSLASEVKAIDPMLDTLRSITSRWDLKTSLSENDRSELQRLILDLKYYLVNRDPLRSFTLEMLDERLAIELEGGENKTPSFLLLLAGCLAATAVAFVIPLPLSDIGRIYLAITVFLTSQISVTVWLYLSSLLNFNPLLRQVFIYLSIGAGLLVVTCLHYVLIGILEVTDYPVFKYGGATEIALTAIAALYVGLGKYAKIVKLSIRSISIQLAVSLAVTVILAILVAYVRGIPDKLFFSISFVATLATGFYAFFGAMVARRVIKNVTASYAKSLRFLYFFLLGVSVTALSFIVALTWFGQLSVGALSILIAFAGIPTMTLFMYSGYSFKKETSR